MTHIAGHNQEYERRQIVARMGKAGYFRMERKKYIIWQFMTFWTGPLTPAVAAEFVRPADIDEHGFLRIEKMRPGEFLVTPGLVYRKVPMTGLIMAEHLKKMKRFRPRDVVEHFKDTDAGVVDLGITDLRTKH